MVQKTTLITGASGKLGKAIISQDLKDRILLTPTHHEMDITDIKSVYNYFDKHSVDEVIHCAAIASVGICEKDPIKAISTNSIGTSYLAQASVKKGSRFVYISTDYVYPCEKGPYKETDEIKPNTVYGWTKLGGELSVKLLKNYCIIRTSFFDPNNILFDTAFTDSFCSKLLISEIAKDIILLLKSDFIGTINVGQKRISLYGLYKEHKPQIKPENMPVEGESKRARDSSLDISLWKNVKGELNGN